MPKICNILLKGKEMTTSEGVVKFDEKGIGEISSEELYREIVTFPNFFPVEEEIDGNPNENADAKGVNTPENSEEQIKDKSEKDEIPVEDDKPESEKEKPVEEEKKVEVKKTPVKKSTAKK